MQLVLCLSTSAPASARACGLPRQRARTPQPARQQGAQAAVRAARLHRPGRAGAATAAPARTATARGEDAAAFDASQQSAGKWALFTAELVAVLGIMYAVRDILYALRGNVYAPAGCSATRARDLAHPPALRSSRRERRACPLPDAPPPALGTLAARREPPS